MVEISWRQRQEIWDWEADTPLTEDQVQLAKDMYSEIDRLHELNRAYRTVLRNVLS